MKFKSFLIFIIMIPAISQGSSSDISKHIQSTVQEQVQKVCRTCRAEVTIHNEAILEDIAKPDKIITDHWKGQTNLLLKLGNKSRLVTVTIRWFDQVVIAAKNIRQGHVITAPDVSVIEKDVTFLKTAYMQSSESAIGLEGRRVFQRGQVLDEAYMKKPLVVKYGQSFRLELIKGPLKLSVTGQAKGAGAIGDRIPFYIPKTRTKVQAVIVTKDLARVQ